MKSRIPAVGVSAIAALLLAACGGDGEGVVTSGTVSGNVVKGPVTDATVTVKNAATGATLATTKTAAGGAYSVTVPFTGDVIVEVTGGTYTDEISGASTPLTATLRSVVNVNGGTVVGVVTPLTSLAFSSAFGSAVTGVNASAFNTAASKLATQFQLTNVNLATALPLVTGSDINAYGRVLRGVSQYLRNQNLALQTLVTSQFTGDALSAFSTNFTTAYRAANTGRTETFSFDGTAFNISGTGVGGGAGSCGVNVAGTVSTAGITVPLNIDYCIAGIAAASCSASNTSLSQGVAGQGGIAGAANLVYTYTPTCKAGAITINLK